MNLCYAQHSRTSYLINFATSHKHQNSSSEIFQNKIVYYVRKRFSCIRTKNAPLRPTPIFQKLCVITVIDEPNLKPIFLHDHNREKCEISILG